MEKILKFLRFEPWKQAFLIQAFAVQFAVRIALGVLPFYVTLSFLQLIEKAARRRPQQCHIHKGNHLPESFSVPQALAWSVRATSPLVPGARCLCQAIAAQVLLALKGFTSELWIGVQKSDPSKLTAHAWLVRQGQILVGNLPNINDYLPLPTLPKVIK